MKKILLLALTISYFSITSNAQSTWTDIYRSSDVKVEMMTTECNAANRMIPYTYGLLRYTNLTNEDITFNFEIQLWYNGTPEDNTPKDQGDPALLKTIQLSANDVVTGECNSTSKYLKVFENTNHPEMPTKLTKIEIVRK